MQLRAPAILIASRAHGETATIARLLTRDHGLLAGYVAGGRGRQLRPVMIPGNLVEVDLRKSCSSHEHFDHVGGLAYLQEKSGAQVVSSVAARKALETGRTQPGDPQHDMHDPFAPVTVSRTVRSFEPVTRGKLSLMPLETPGHTPGALSWQWWSCEGTDCRTMVYADSLSPIGRDDYSFSNHPQYLANYRAGLEALAEAPCDLLVTPHPSASWMLGRMESDTGLFGKGNCRKYADAINARLDDEVQLEAEEK